MFEGFTAGTVKTSGADIRVVHGGAGPPVLLLHGFPQTHVMWHLVAPALSRRFTVVAADLRGYGDSSKPPDGTDHAGYCKRATAQDQMEVMAQLGFERFAVIGHDRGGRVAHRLALDHPARVSRLAVLDIVPTHHVFAHLQKRIALQYYHWFFLAQPYDFPERLIGSDPDYFLDRSLGKLARDGVITPQAMEHYRRCFRDPAMIHAGCEDYRAAAGIDLEHDEADLDRRLTCPVLALWGLNGAVHQNYDVIAAWRERAEDVRGAALNCGHFIAEEAPGPLLDAVLPFLSA